MPNLFVDCDDTLILWNVTLQADGIYKTEGYRRNLELIGDVECFLATHRDYELVIWSGGGMDYARRWAEECFPNTNFSISDKDMRHPHDKDILVDDMYGEIAPQDKRVRVLPPGGLRHCPLCQ